MDKGAALDAGMGRPPGASPCAGILEVGLSVAVIGDFRLPGYLRDRTMRRRAEWAQMLNATLDR